MGHDASRPCSAGHHLSLPKTNPPKAHAYRCGFCGEDQPALADLHYECKPCRFCVCPRCRPIGNEPPDPPDVVRLMDAVRRSDLKQLEAELDHNPAAVRFIDREGFTAFQRAFTMHKWAAVILLAERGSNVNRYNLNGANAFHSLTNEKKWTDLHEQVMRCLLKHGADVAAPSYCPLSTADTPLSCAVSLGNHRAVRLLLATGKVNVNHVSRAGTTALFEAAVRFDREATIMLLHEGAIIPPNIWSGDFRPPWEANFDVAEKSQYVAWLQIWRPRKIP